MTKAMPDPPHLAAHTVLIDVDETITHTRDDSFLYAALLDAVASAHGIDATQADRRIRAVCDPNNEDVEPHLAALGIEMTDYLHALVEAARPHVEAYADAVTMIRSLHETGFALYPATTNGRGACMAKLSAAGLGDVSGSPFFAELFGGAQVSPEGKSGPTFYHALLKRIDTDPRHVVMIGDNPQADLAYAKAAGIEQVILPRREQPQPWIVEEDGGIYVDSLAIVPEFLEFRRC